MNFYDWVNKQLNSVANDIIAYCFNLYETEHPQLFDVQLIGSKEFTPNNDDWACHACFSSGEYVYSFYAHDWEDAMQVFKKQLQEYMLSKKCNSLLKTAKVAFGFVDGDLEYL